jgi:hypothetical protein
MKTNKGQENDERGSNTLGFDLKAKLQALLNRNTP